MSNPMRILSTEEMQQVEKWAADFLSAQQIAGMLGIGKTTFYEICKRQPELTERYQRGRAKGVVHITSKLLDIINGDNPSLALQTSMFLLKTRAGFNEKSTQKEEEEIEKLSIVEKVNVNLEAMRATFKRFLRFEEKEKDRKISERG